MTNKIDAVTRMNEQIPMRTTTTTTVNKMNEAKIREEILLQKF